MLIAFTTMSNFKYYFILFIVSVNFFYGTNSYFLDLGPINHCEESIATETCQPHVTLYFNSLNSEESFISHDYNYFGLCAADGSNPDETLEQVLLGEKIRPSTYNISFLKDINCGVVCQKTYNLTNDEDITELSILKEGIFKKYQHHWIIDNLPVTKCIAADSQQFCSTGFPIGYYADSSGLKFYGQNTFYLHNHVDILIFYETGEYEPWGVDFKDKGGRITRIKVQPRSIQNQLEKGCSPSFNLLPMAIPDDLKTNTFTISYTYSVAFIKDNTVRWSSRWDYIFASFPHLNDSCFSLPVVILLFLTCIVAIILYRTLYKNVVPYHEIKSACGAQNKDLKGITWSLVSGDIYRTPKNEMLFSVFIGNGVQVFYSILTTLSFCYVTLCPFETRFLMLFGVVHYVSAAICAGLTSAATYKMFRGINCKLNGILTATLTHGCIFVFSFLLNLVPWVIGSSSAISFKAFLPSILLCFGIGFLLSFIGIYSEIKPVLKTLPINETSSEIPQLLIHIKSNLDIILGGFVVFVCNFYQLFFILNYIWVNDFYRTIGFLLLDFLMLTASCFETTIILCYFRMCKGHFHWWWHSFLTSGFSAFYVFLYCIFFFHAQLSITDKASVFLYFGYTILIVFLYFLLSGTVGFYGCFYFIRMIRESIRHHNFLSTHSPLHASDNHDSSKVFKIEDHNTSDMKTKNEKHSQKLSGEDSVVNNIPHPTRNDI